MGWLCSGTSIWLLQNIVYFVLSTLSNSLLICNQSFIEDKFKMIYLLCVDVPSFDFSAKVKICSFLIWIIICKHYNVSVFMLPNCVSDKMRKRKGPRTDPCGTPVVTFWERDFLQLYVTCCILSLRNLAVVYITYCFIYNYLKIPLLHI